MNLAGCIRRVGALMLALTLVCTSFSEEVLVLASEVGTETAADEQVPSADDAAAQTDAAEEDPQTQASADASPEDNDTDEETDGEAAADQADSDSAEEEDVQETTATQADALTDDPDEETAPDQAQETSDEEDAQEQTQETSDGENAPDQALETSDEEDAQDQTQEISDEADAQDQAQETSDGETVQDQEQETTDGEDTQVQAGILEEETISDEAQASAAAEDSLTEAEALVTELTELVDYYTSQEGDTMYALLNWMLSDAYTGETLSDDQITDIEDALMLIGTFVDNGYMTLDNYQDAIDLDLVSKALTTIDGIEEYRIADENYDLDEIAVLTNFTMLTGAAFSADASRNAVSHVAQSLLSGMGVSSYYSASPENLAYIWAGYNADERWYSEIDEFNLCRDELGYNDGDALTSSEISKIKSLASSYGYTIGHYTNLMYSYSSTDDILIGVGVCTIVGINRCTMSYSCAKTSKYSYSYTTDEIRAFFTAYDTYIDSLESDLEEAIETYESLSESIGLAAGRASLTDAVLTFSADSYTYSPSAPVEPQITVTLDGTTLEEGTDYVTACSDNTSVGTAVIKVTGIRDYCGTITDNYTISRRKLTADDVEIAAYKYEYTGSAITVDFVVTVDGTELNGSYASYNNYTDYAYNYQDNTDLGKAYLFISGYNNYTGSVTINFYIMEDVDNCDHTYTSVITTSAGCTTTGVRTYTCSGCGDVYTEEIAARGHRYRSTITTKATCTTTGVRTYTCTRCGDSYTEEIAAAGHSYRNNVCRTCGALKSSSIADASVTLSVTSYTYDGTAKKPSVTVKINGTTLTSGTDYTVTYKNNTNAGTARVTVTGTGSYSGAQTVTFTIKESNDSLSSSSSGSKTSISNYTAALSYTSKTYTGSALKPSVTVKSSSGTTLSSSNYTVSYKNNTSIGTATVTITGTGNYTGTITKTFTIKAQSLSSSNAALSYTSKTYTGSALKPSVTVKNSSGSTLIKNTDYTVSYKNNTNAGTATVTITGKGNYTGTVTKTFKIKAKALSSKKVSLSYTKASYTGKSRKPSVTVKNSSGATLTKNTDYTVSYKNNKSIGTATVTIKGTGNYTGTITKTFKIVPKKTSISSVKSSKSKTLTVKWKKVSGSVTKYQIRYRVKGSSEWTKVTVSSSKLSKTISKLKSGKTYEVQVRSYKTVDGRKYVSSWSGKKTVKVK